MEEESLSHEQSLELITKMINQGKNYYYESGTVALLWGFSNVICFTLAYLQATVKGFHLPITPFILLVPTFFLQLYFDRKESKRRKATTYIEEAMNYVWMTFGFAVLILTVVGGIANMGYVTLPVLLLLFGMPTFTTGLICKFHSMTIGGILCWTFCIIAFLYQGYFAFLLCAAGATVAWIIPGFIMRSTLKKQIREEQNQQNGI